MSARVLSLMEATQRRRGGSLPPDDPRLRYFEALVREVVKTDPLYFRMKLDSALRQAVSEIANEVSTDVGVTLLVSLAKHLKSLDDWIADIERQIRIQQQRGGA